MSELCLRDEKIMTLKDGKDGAPCGIAKIHAPELLPLCLGPECTFEQFMEWLKGRTVPASREGLKEAKARFKGPWLEPRNYASLSDHYWLKRRSETYRKVSFFSNPYSTDIGDIFFKPWLVSGKRYDTFSPDLATGGVLRKAWRQDVDRTSWLVKAGSRETHQEPLSEVLVAVLAEQLGVIKCADYTLHIEGLTMCSKCRCFVTPGTDMVPASYIYDARTKEKSETVLDHLLRACEKHDIPDAEHFLKWMVFIDHITGNEDRNLSNIAFLRDLKTMKFIGPAPLFDSGNAYWNTKSVNEEPRSRMFGDVADDVFHDLCKKGGVDRIMEASDYVGIISTYPCISDVKKDNLIKAIGKRNKRLMMIRDMKKPER